MLSIIVPTKNEEKNIRRIVQSITKNPEFLSADGHGSPEKVEIIIVDNTKSSDNTSKIVSELKHVRLFAKGPERSAQRNCGAQNAKGDILIFLDADMILTHTSSTSSPILHYERGAAATPSPNVGEGRDEVHSRQGEVKTKQGLINEIIEFYKNPENKNTALVIPERVSGKTIYAKARNLEKQIYSHNEVISAARVYPKDIFLKIGGFNEEMTSGEDWELDRRFRKNGGTIGFTNCHLIHNEKDLGFVGALKKKVYYAKKLKNHNVGFQTEVNPFYRMMTLFSAPRLITKSPFTFIYLIALKLAEFSFGSWIYFTKKL